MGRKYLVGGRSYKRDRKAVQMRMKGPFCRLFRAVIDLGLDRIQSVFVTTSREQCIPSCLWLTSKSRLIELPLPAGPSITPFIATALIHFKRKFSTRGGTPENKRIDTEITRFWFWFWSLITQFLAIMKDVKEVSSVKNFSARLSDVYTDDHWLFLLLTTTIMIICPFFSTVPWSRQ